MTIPNEDETLPNVMQEAQGEPPRPPKPRRRGWVWLGILTVLLFAGAGGWFGYQTAMQQRKAAQAGQVTAAATTQYELGVAALSEGRLALAQQRFEYVLDLDPTFPGAAEKLAEAMILQAQILTPTPAPSPTVSPTPDMRGVEEIFNQAVGFVRS